MPCLLHFRYGCYDGDCLGWHVVTEGIDPYLGISGKIVCYFLGYLKVDLLVMIESLVSYFFGQEDWGMFFALLIFPGRREESK